MVVHTFAAIYIGTYDVSLKVFEFMDKKKFHQVDHIRARLDLGSDAFAEGRIGYEEKGENGFGYDPIFYLPQYGKYSAELSSDEKNAISHRGEALRRIREVL